MLRLASVLLCAALWLPLAHIPSAAQVPPVVIEGSDDYRAVRIARAILARGSYTVISGDTVLPPTFQTAGDLVITSGDVRLEGVVGGEVAVLGGGLFVRPGASVGGRIAVVGGGVYPSGLATVGEIVRLPPGTRASEPAPPAAAATAPASPVRVVVESPSAVRFEPLGFFGLLAPEYDRVNGVTVTGAVRWSIRTRGGEATVAPSLSYYSARGEIGGGATAAIPVYPTVSLELDAGRTVATNDRWVRGDILNTLASLTFANDLRDYYETDLARATLRRALQDPVLEGEFKLIPFVAGQVERDRPLRARMPWSLFGDDEDWRGNLQVPELTLGTVTAGTAARWKGGTTSFEGELSLEQAVYSSDERLFTQLAGDGLWTMSGLASTDALSVSAHLSGSFGRTAPRQRWSFVGGVTTLPTTDPAIERGDNVVFVRSVYARELPSVVLPVVGIPTAELIHAIGTAWTRGGPGPGWRQNLGAGLRLAVVEAAFYLDPADTSSNRFIVGLSVPAF